MFSVGFPGRGIILPAWLFSGTLVSRFFYMTFEDKACIGKIYSVKKNIQGNFSQCMIIRLRII